MNPRLACSPHDVLSFGNTVPKGAISAKERDFWRDNLIFGGASILTGLFNYLYHVVLAHVLGPGDYGNFTTCLNVTALLALPGGVVTLLYTRLGRRPQHGTRESLALWTGGAGLWAALVILRHQLSRIFHVPSLLLVVFTLETIPSLVLAANLGILQRARRYVWVGFLNILNTGFRIIAAAAAVLAHLGLDGVGLLEGVAAWVAWGASRLLSSRVSGTGEPSRTHVVAGTAVVGTINVLMGVTDGLLAKSALPPIRAGLFNGLATIGHTVQFFSTSFGTVMLTSIIARPHQEWYFFGRTVAFYLALALTAELFFTVLGPTVVLVILGARFLSIVTWLPYYGLGMVSLGLLNIVMLYSVARKRWLVIISTSIGLGTWVYRLLSSHTIAAFVHVTTDVMVLTLLASLVLLVGVEGLPRLRVGLKSRL